MNDPLDLTPKERYVASLNKDVIFAKTLTRTLCYVIPSLALVVYAIVSNDYGYGLVGYGILLFREVVRLRVLKSGLETRQNILNKYEAKLRSKQEPS